MIQLLLVSIGGALGAVLRYTIGKLTSKIVGGKDFFTGTFFSNMIGCFFAGFMLAWMGDSSNISQGSILFLSVGILGSVTTFSTFALETSQLLDKGNIIKMISYLFIQVVTAFLLTATGYTLYQFVGLG